MQIENIKISPAEVRNFPTALRYRRLAFGMNHAGVSELLGGEYTSLQIYTWEAGANLPSVEEGTKVLATLAYVQSEILDAYRKTVQDIIHLRLPVLVKMELLSPSTQEEYEILRSDTAEKIPLAGYRVLLDMLHERLGLPIVTMGGEPEREEIFS